MAASVATISPINVALPHNHQEDVDTTTTTILSPDLPIDFIQDPTVKAPFEAIQRLFDHLRSHPSDVDAINSAYPKRGILKTAAVLNPKSDQKFTFDLSPHRVDCLPGEAQQRLSEIITFFEAAASAYVEDLLSACSNLAGPGVDMAKAHTNRNWNFRLCDYATENIANPESDNGCGAHTDYGTFTIIFQDGTPGLEIEDPSAPTGWSLVPGDATIVLAGWCAAILSGGRIRAARHRVRRVPGVRRLSAVLFVAPDLDVKLTPLPGVKPVRPFTERISSGEEDVAWFKEVMGKRWRHREGNEDIPEGELTGSQDDDINKLVWA
ncbi:oxidoreductase [Phyllosticta capitalensis]|uniref:Oxidoreductase n=1 Tax=Phyllosticta capitalensis TaxID=121624 RepID=A0ABR1Z460_9PEZI